MPACVRTFTRHVHTYIHWIYHKDNQILFADSRLASEHKHPHSTYNTRTLAHGPNGMRATIRKSPFPHSCESPKNLRRMCLSSGCLRLCYPLPLGPETLRCMCLRWQVGPAQADFWRGQRDCPSLRQQVE